MGRGLEHPPHRRRAGSSRPPIGRRLVFAPTPWLDTLWKYRQPTNHVAYSVAARISLAGWRAATGAERSAFDEVALRLPAWLAAWPRSSLLGLLVRALGFPAAAPAAAFLLAIHPWHLRYGADGRGYSFVVLATLASALFLLRALREDRWRFWLAAAASQALMLWTLPDRRLRAARPHGGGGDRHRERAPRRAAAGSRASSWRTSSPPWRTSS